MLIFFILYDKLLTYELFLMCIQIECVEQTDERPTTKPTTTDYDKKGCCKTPNIQALTYFPIVMLVWGSE